MLKTRMSLAVLLALIGFWFLAPATALAQTGCTPQTLPQNLAAFADNQAAGSITPGRIRNLDCSVDNASYNVMGYGAKCDGATDDTIPINAANTAASSAGAGRVQFPAGTCITSQITILPNVNYVGQGRDATIIKLKAGANATVFLGQNFASLTGTNVTTGVGGFGIQGLTIDGNKANNSAGDGIQCYCYGFDIKDVSIKNTAADGMYTEWSSNTGCPTNTPPDCMEAFFSNMVIHDYAGNGWVFKGPHDSQVNRIIIYTFSNANAKGMWLTSATAGSGNALTGTTVHVWGNNAWGIYADSTTNGVVLSNVMLEGAVVGQLMDGGFQSQYDGTIYNCGSTSVTAQQTGATTLAVTVNASGFPITPGMTVSGTGITAGTRITAGTIGPTGSFTTTSSGTSSSEAVVIHGAGLWYGDASNSATEFGSRIKTIMSNTCGVSWVYEGGNNQLDMTIQDGASLPLVGAPSNYLTDQFTNWNYITGLGTVVLSACGTSPVANSSNPSHGVITLGTGSPTACTMTVATGNAWPRAPVCSVTAKNGTAWGMSAVSTTAVTFTGSATTTTLYYQCTP